MTHPKPNKKMKRNVQRVVGDDPSLAGVAWPFLYQNDVLFKLEVLASVLNDVPPGSPDRAIAELIERLVSTPPAWVKVTAPIIGPTLCEPAPGSPLYVLNKFLSWNPCALRITGLERANGNIEICADHLPISVPALYQKQLGISDEQVVGFVKNARTMDQILWVLWEVFYRKVDLTRLKTCPICHRWFVDHSKNKTKIRCSAVCTSKRWSWEARKSTVGSRKAKGGKYAKAKKA
jgi:hypothetical protein